MPKNILDTLVSVGGIAGEYEALTEAEISSVPGAPYTPPEPYDNFRVVANRVVQLLGGAPWFFKTFQTSSFTLRVPSGSLTNNDAQDGRVFFIENSASAVGDVIIETSAATPLLITTLSPGDAVVLFHEDSDSWSKKFLTDFIVYRYTNSNRVPNRGIRYYRTGPGVRCSSVGDVVTHNVVLRSISSAVNVADINRTYNVEVLLNPSTTPTVLASLLIDGNVSRFTQVNGLSISVSSGSEVGVRVVKVSGVGRSSFSDHNVSVVFERV